MPGIYNCDWFSFTADFENYNPRNSELDKRNTFNPDENKLLARLMEQFDEQRAREDGNGFIDLGLFKMRVYPHGNRSYYYLLECDDLELYMMRWRSKNEENYPVYVHFKSQFLWSDLYGTKTLADKFALVIEWLEMVCNGKYKASKINRCDLAYHTDDIPSGYTADHFVGKHTLDETMRTHRLISAINIGSRKSDKIYFRSYNKFLEARAKRKQWFFELWLNAGMDVRKVWNCEFQLSRQFFTETWIGGKKLDTAEAVIDNQAAIWRYLTCQWLTYRIPDDDRRSRWSIHDWWLLLQQYHESTVKISRGRQRELPTRSAIVPPLIGYLASYAARTGDTIDGTLIDLLQADLEDYEKRTGLKFDDIVEFKRSLMDPEDETDVERENKKEPLQRLPDYDHGHDL